MLDIQLKKGRDTPVRNGSPWVFSGSIARVAGAAEPGAPCRVIADSGETLGHGYYNERSTLCVRLLTRGDRLFNAGLLRDRIAMAIQRRLSMLAKARRLVNSEGDFLPGLIVDQYGSGVCVQFGAAGMNRWRDEIITFLKDALSPSFIFERSDTEAAVREGLDAHSGLLHGALPDPLTITEHDVSFQLDLAAGQKTGFYLDQRDNRLLIRQYCAGKRVLDCFCYSGGFALNAVKVGAESTVGIDASKKALALAERNRSCNDMTERQLRFRAADVFKYLRESEDRRDVIILDPPKFAKHPGHVRRAARGYKDINLLALKNLSPEGVLFTFSCSQAINATLFRQIVFGAAIDAGRRVQVLHVLHQSPDHPVDLAHREGDYLTGLALRVL
jgi:23S rRNA (cytosine1962-C5)-methyltransferase